MAKATVPSLGYRVHPGMSTLRYKMGPNILSCRVGMRVAGDTPGASAWDVELVSGAATAEGLTPGSITDPPRSAAWLVFTVASGSVL